LVGGGLASVTAAETLRRGGAKGSIAILAAENALPYHRPPLSKDFLVKGPEKTNILIHTDAFYRERDIAIHLGTRVCRVDVDKRTIETEHGTRCRFGKLLIATGASVDELSVPGVDLEGIHYLHTVDHGRALYDDIAHVQRAVVIGASFIGMELAAAFATRGIHTTLIARRELLYSKLGSPEVSRFFAEHYRTRGVELILGDSAERFCGTARVESIVTKAGKVVPCELVAVGIGVRPEVGFLRDSGIALDDGILVNHHLETNQPGIYAAGDVANFYDPITRSRRRSEHWDNAVKQGRVAAWNMLGDRQPWRTLSYFFSDVFDFTFNVVGDTSLAHERIVRRSPEDEAFSVVYLANDQLRGAFLLEI
jgi:NTE family protein